MTQLSPQQVQNGNVIAFSPYAAAQEPLTMSSREIADLVNSRHDDVKRSIERLAERGVIQLPPLADVKNHKGQSVKEYLIGKRDSYIIVAQLSPEFTARLVDRWQELEAQALQPIDYSHPRVMLGVLTHLKDENERLTGLVEHQGERLQILDRLEGAQGSLILSDAAKTLKIKRSHFIETLISRKWVFRRKRDGNLVAYDKARHAGMVEHRETDYHNNYTGEKHIATQVLITAKGMSRLAELIEKGKLH